MRLFGWIALALAGLLLAAGITYAASRLSSQPVGLTSEPLSAGEALAPRATATPKPRAKKTPASPKRNPRATRTPTPATTPATTPAPTPAATPAGAVEPGEDSSGSGKGRGRDHSGGGDDD